MTKTETKTKLLIGFHTHIPLQLASKNGENGDTKNYFDFIRNILELLQNTNNIKAAFHISGTSISLIDKKLDGFSNNIRTLLDRNQIELLGGGLYEPIFSFTPKEDRQTQLMLMGRLLNHTFGYTPNGAWITELSWDPSFAIDFSKSRIHFTCLPKEYFIQSGINENDLGGYFITEEEGRKVAVFPILFELNKLIKDHTPESAVELIIKKVKETNSTSSSASVFYRCNNSSKEDISWINKFFSLINESGLFETLLFSDYFHNYKPKGRVYLPAVQYNSLNNGTYWKHSILNNYEVNLLHKKMLRVSKKINSAKEGKSRFKVIKEMINQAHDLLLKGQTNDAYISSEQSGIQFPQQRHNTYKNLIKAENLIDSASKQGSKWIQAYEIDYDCDGHDEIIVETETQNIYISPSFGGAILEHDYRPKNINITNVLSRKKEWHHSTENRKSTFDYYQKLNLIDHFLDNDISLEKCISNNLPHLTKEVIKSYGIEKIKAKEEVCKITLNSLYELENIDDKPQIYLEKQISVRSGDSSVFYEYKLTNKSSKSAQFNFGIEFNFNITPDLANECFIYVEGDKAKKSNLPSPAKTEEIKDLKQISIFNKSDGLDLSLSFGKPCTLFRHPVETIQKFTNSEEIIYQGTTFLPVWKINIEPEAVWEISIKEDINPNSAEL